MDEADKIYILCLAPHSNLGTVGGSECWRLWQNISQQSFSSLLILEDCPAPTSQVKFADDNIILLLLKISHQTFFFFLLKSSGIQLFFYRLKKLGLLQHQLSLDIFFFIRHIKWESVDVTSMKIKDPIYPNNLLVGLSLVSQL